MSDGTQREAAGVGRGEGQRVGDRPRGDHRAGGARRGLAAGAAQRGGRLPDGPRRGRVERERIDVGRCLLPVGLPGRAQAALGPLQPRIEGLVEIRAQPDGVKRRQTPPPLEEHLRLGCRTPGGPQLSDGLAGPGHGDALAGGDTIDHVAAVEAQVADADVRCAHTGPHDVGATHRGRPVATRSWHGATVPREGRGQPPLAGRGGSGWLAPAVG